MQTHDGIPVKGKKRGRARNAPRFDLRTQLFRMCGVDLTRIDGIDVTTALAVISETGTDMSRFATVKHFTCWLGLCPGTKITGGKVMSGRTKRCANRAAQALRHAGRGLRVRVGRQRQDAQAAVLRQRATGPTLPGMRLKPARSQAMMHVIAVMQRDQHIDIEQRPHLTHPLRRAGGRSARC